MNNFTPQEIVKFQEFLKDKQAFIRTQVSSDLSKQIIDLTFAILQKELDYEFEEEAKKEADYYGYSR